MYRFGYSLTHLPLLFGLGGLVECFAIVVYAVEHLAPLALRCGRLTLVTLRGFAAFRVPRASAWVTLAVLILILILITASAVLRVGGLVFGLGEYLAVDPLTGLSNVSLIIEAALWEHEPCADKAAIDRVVASGVPPLVVSPIFSEVMAVGNVGYLVSENPSHFRNRQSAYPHRIVDDALAIGSHSVYLKRWLDLKPKEQ